MFLYVQMETHKLLLASMMSDGATKYLLLCRRQKTENNLPLWMSRWAMAGQPQTDKPHAVMFTSPGMGHLIPFCELARRLAADFSCKVTLILSKDLTSTVEASPFLTSLASSALDINIIYLTDIDIGNPGMIAEARISLIISNSIPRVIEILKSFKEAGTPVSAFIVDFFCSAAIASSADQQIPTYVFLTSATAFLTVMFEVPVLTSQVTVSFKDVQFGIKLEGLPTIPGHQMPDPLLDRSEPSFDAFVSVCHGIRQASGILINTFDELEPNALHGFRRRWGNLMPRLYAVGPLPPPAEMTNAGKGADCLHWLDQQPDASVVFVSFGSGATPFKEQLLELADGLERSGHRFLWVVRKQAYKSPASGYFGIPETNVEELVPEGFLEKTKDRGLVVPAWAPQMAVLSHPSVGGFMSHCGWNSTIESIYCGVPMITWPMFAEQRMNAIMIKDVYRVGVDLKIESSGYVKGFEVERSVTELMEGPTGMNARKRSKELMKKAREAMEKGGSSWNAMAAAVSLHKICQERR